MNWFSGPAQRVMNCSVVGLAALPASNLIQNGSKRDVVDRVDAASIWEASEIIYR